MDKVNEVAPPYWGHTKADKSKGVKKGGTAEAMKKAQKQGRIPKKYNIFALMWSMKKKGAKPHYKPGKINKLKKKYKAKNESVYSRICNLLEIAASKPQDAPKPSSNRPGRATVSHPRPRFPSAGQLKLKSKLTPFVQNQADRQPPPTTGARRPPVDTRQAFQAVRSELGRRRAMSKAQEPERRQATISPAPGHWQQHKATMDSPEALDLAKNIGKEAALSMMPLGHLTKLRHLRRAGKAAPVLKRAAPKVDDVADAQKAARRAAPSKADEVKKAQEAARREKATRDAAEKARLEKQAAKRAEAAPDAPGQRKFDFDEVEPAKKKAVLDAIRRWSPKVGVAAAGSQIKGGPSTSPAPDTDLAPAPKAKESPSPTPQPQPKPQPEPVGDPTTTGTATQVPTPPKPKPDGGGKKKPPLPTAGSRNAPTPQDAVPVPYSPQKFVMKKGVDPQSGGRLKRSGSR